MGVQCNIMLSYYTEKYTEIDEIRKYLGLRTSVDKYNRELDETEISPIGNRAFGAASMQVEIICMKDWYYPQCREFILFLKTVDWQFPGTVQVYFNPATFDNYQCWILVNSLSDFQ